VRISLFNLALYEISVLEGISIIDVDRMIAELGAENHVVGPMTYSDAAYHHITQEFLRVMEDIGFFEHRPLMLQIGKRPKAGDPQ
jgi:hypothetical protein